MTATGSGTPDRAPDPPDAKHVQVIDHGPEFLAYARLRLQERGYAVTTTNPTRRTVALAAALAPDLVVCGLGAGGASVLALAERLAGDPATTGIPLILTASHLDLLERTRRSPPSSPASSACSTQSRRWN